MTIDDIELKAVRYRRTSRRFPPLRVCLESLCKSSTSDPYSRTRTLQATEPDSSEKGDTDPWNMRYVKFYYSSTTSACILTFSDVDVCKTSTFALSWLCSSCGEDFCGECVAHMESNPYTVCSCDPPSISPPLIFDHPAWSWLYLRF
jgi:hypothetical protein